MSKGWYDSTILILGLNEKPKAWRVRALSYEESVLRFMKKADIDFLYKD